MLINGKQADASEGKTIDVINPYDGSFGHSTGSVRPGCQLCD